jgi:hypothetical protein
MSLVQEVTPAYPAKGAAFSLHPLIRDWLQLRERGRRRQTLTRECANMIVDSILVVEDRGSNARVKQSLLLHMDASIRNEKEFFKAGRQLGEEVGSCEQAQRFAGFYRSQGKYDLSILLQTVAHRTMTGGLGAEHPDTLMSMNSLAGVLSDQGKHEQAEEILRQALKLEETLLGGASIHPSEHEQPSFGTMESSLGRRGK